MNRQDCIGLYRDLEKMVGKADALQLFNNCNDCKTKNWNDLYSALGSLIYWNDEEAQEREYRAEKQAERANEMALYS